MEQEIYGCPDGGLQRWRYCAVVEYCRSFDLGRYETYGILAASRIPQGWKLSAILHDVTSDCGAAKKMAAKFTDFQLSPVHFRDVVEDMLP